jgi:hypothetical protein
MTPVAPRLCELSFAFRVATSAVVLALLLGLGTSLAQIGQHHERRDGEPCVSYDDVAGAYHGVHAPSKLAAALAGGHPPELAAAERSALQQWLAGTRVSEDYDDPDRGASAPAEILEAACLRCHSRKSAEGDGIGERVPLEYWDDVKQLAFARSIEPVPAEILVTSTHTHAPSLALITLAVLALLHATRFPPRLRGALALGAGCGLVLDLAGWWLARSSELWVLVLIAGGAAWAASIVLASLLVLLELWLPGRAGGRS